MAAPFFDFAKVHEREVVDLHLDALLPVPSVMQALADLGFRGEDDFAYLPRADRVEPWQASDICQASFYLADQEVDREGACDHVGFEHLFAAVPRAASDQFLLAVGSAQRAVGGHFQYRGQAVELTDLEKAMDRFRSELYEELAEQQGSESLRVLLLQFRPRPGGA